MRKLLLIGLVPLAAVTMAAPALSQVYVQPVPGVEVDVGGPRHRYHDEDWRYRHARDECRVVRERIETPSGRVIIRTRREC
jgi:hypothetical protein